MKKLLLALLFLLGANVSSIAQTTLPWGQGTGASSAMQLRTTDGTWVTVGTINNTTHKLIAFGMGGQTVYAGSFATGTPTSPGVACQLNAGNALGLCTAAQLGAQLGSGSVLLSALATQAANTVVANFTGSTASPVAFTMPSCASPSFLDYTNGTGIICSAITANGVTLGNIAQIPANTILSNFTAGTANVVANTINSGSSCATALTYTNGTGIGCAAGAVSSITMSGGIGSFATNPITTSGTIFQNNVVKASGMRLTLTSGTPVLTSGVTGATSIILTPYTSNGIFLSMPSPTNSDALVGCAEISNVLANSSVGNAGPAAVVAGGVYDLFVWSNAGTLSSPACVLTRGPAWTNSTTRSAGTALSRTNGILRNSVSITNGPAANQGTYVGTFVADGGAGTVSYTFGGSAAGGVAGNLNVWNMYNRITATCGTTDSGTSYTYSTATIRQTRASSGNQCNFVIGVSEDSIQAFSKHDGFSSSAAGGGVLLAGIGLNSTTAAAGAFSNISAPAASAVMLLFGHIGVQPAIGVNFVAAVEEYLGGANTGTWDSDSNSTLTLTVRQ